MDRLSLYNDALRLVGERKLASLSEARESRRLLDDAWDSNAYDTWLEEADWNFAMKFVKIQYNPSITLTFGYRYAFDKPDDMVRLSGVWLDGYQQIPLTRYSDESKKIYSDRDEIYIAYVSNDSTHGSDIGTWPKSFGRYIAAFLANEIAPRIKNDIAADSISKVLEGRLLSARNKDAMKNPSKQLPRGSWANSRASRTYYGED